MVEYVVAYKAIMYQNIDVNRWSRESVLEACRVVDQQRLAEGIMLPLTSRDINMLSAESPDFPSEPTVEAYVGGVDMLHIELGRVTTKLAMGWTEDEWRQNAQWTNELLIEKGIDMLGQPELSAFSAARLMPNSHVIKRVWGTLGNYRLQNGIEPFPTYQSAKAWERSEYVDNGKELARHLGRDFGMPLMPTQDDIAEGTKEDRTPTTHQIYKKFSDGGIEEYQSSLGFVNAYTLKHWTAEQWRENLEWLLEIATQNGVQTSSIGDLLAAAGRLHIGPSRDAAVARWGNLISYGNLVGRETEQRKRMLSNEGVLRAAINIVAKKKQPLQADDVAEHSSLGANMVKRRFGGLQSLNLRLGYIVGAKNWDNNMMAWWGLAKFYQSEGRYPNRTDMGAWSKDDRGPSPTKMFAVFGRIDNFHAELDHAAHWLDVQVANLLTTGLPKPFIKLALLTNHEIFTPDQELGRDALKIFTDLKHAGIDMNYIGHLMHAGIPFEDPEAHLTALAEHLRDNGMLRSGILRQLEPYIIGLAPLHVEDSWSSFVQDHKETAPALQVA